MSVKRVFPEVFYDPPESQNKPSLQYPFAIQSQKVVLRRSLNEQNGHFPADSHYLPDSNQRNMSELESENGGIQHGLISDQLQSVNRFGHLNGVVEGELDQKCSSACASTSVSNAICLEEKIRKFETNLFQVKNRRADHYQLPKRLKLPKFSKDLVVPSQLGLEDTMLPVTRK